jgi:hypothetical protein
VAIVPGLVARPDQPAEAPGAVTLGLEDGMQKGQYPKPLRLHLAQDRIDEEGHVVV